MKYFKILLGLFSIFIVFYLIITYYKFPVKLYNCNSIGNDCFIDSKHRNLFSCETTRERQTWYCDSTNKNNITCREGKVGESTIKTFCSK